MEVKFGGRLEEHWDQGHLMQQYIDYETVLAVPYNMYVSGYDTEAVSVLRLWKAKSPGIDMECFNNGDYLGAFRKTARAETISKASCTPMITTRRASSCACASSISWCAPPWRRSPAPIWSATAPWIAFAELNAIQLNDTHPTLAIPELMRILMDDCGYSWEKELGRSPSRPLPTPTIPSWRRHWKSGISPCSGSCCPVSIRSCRRSTAAGISVCGRNSAVITPRWKKMQILRDGKVHMANLCVVGGHYVNGVSKLHSQINQG